MNGNRWSKFWWQDWQGDKALRTVSLAARGLWMELLCIAHDAEPYGHVLINGRSPSAEMLASLVGVRRQRELSSLLVELESAGIFSRNADGIIYCRRMVRDKATSDAGRESGRKGGNPALNGKDHEPKKPAGGLTPPLNPPPLTPDLTPPVKSPLKLEAEAESEAERKGSERAREHARPPTLRPEDWRPNDAMIAFGRSLGLSPSVVIVAGDRMRDHVLATGKPPRNWEAKFRNWLRGDAERGRPKLSQFDQIHMELGTTSLLMPLWNDDDPPTLTGRLLQ